MCAILGILLYTLFDMKLSDLGSAIPQDWQGKIASMRLYTLDIDVRVLDIDKKRTHSLALVTPLAGSGQRWMPLELLAKSNGSHDPAQLFDVSTLSKML